MAINIFPVTLKEAFMISPKVKHFIFVAQESPAFNYLAGQFITIHFEHEGHAFKRSYSIANVPCNNNCIEFAAGYVENGPGTAFLFNLKEGDTINISGPYGRLILKDEQPERYILVSTSTGVTPYRAMLAELEKRLHESSTLQIVILHGVQKRDDLIYAQEFANFAQNFPRVLFRPHLSRHSVDNLQNNEYKGYVQESFAELALDPNKDHIYLCGNPAMIDESFELLKNQGFTTQQIIREKYISR